MITDEQLNEYRLNGTRVRIIRDANEANDVRGFVVAWDDEVVIIRKQNRKVLKLPRTYTCQPANAERPVMY